MFLISAAAKGAFFQSIPVRDGVKLFGRGRIFVSKRDGRGKLLRECAGVTQPLINVLWRQMVDLVRPTVLLDIGANYGEIGLSCRYSAQSQLYFIEGNPNIVSYLKRSVESHRDATKMKIIECLVSDNNDMERW